MQKYLIAFVLMGFTNSALGQQYGTAPAGLEEASIAATSQCPASDENQPQVLLHILVVEISHTKLRNMGFDVSRVFGDPAQSKRLVEVVDALRKEGFATILAEPNVVTTSSHAATVQVGGRARVAVGVGGGKCAIEDRDYGTRVDVAPVVLHDQKIHLQLRVEISRLDRAHPLTVAGETAPILVSKVLDTQGDYKAGESVVLGGLVTQIDPSTTAAKAGTKLPAKKSGGLTETLFIITPEIATAARSKTAAVVPARR
jgi:Flp pilus assembly secretin CpaC